MSCAVDSYKKEAFQARPLPSVLYGRFIQEFKDDNQARPLPNVLCGRFIQERRLPNLAVTKCSVWPIHTRKKTDKLDCGPMSCEADSYKKEDHQARPLPNVLCV